MKSGDLLVILGISYYIYLSNPTLRVIPCEAILNRERFLCLRPHLTQFLTTIELSELTLHLVTPSWGRSR